MRLSTALRAAISAAAIASALVTSACSSSDGPASHGMSDHSMGSSHMEWSSGTTSVSPADVMFAQMMIPHHSQAVEMADLAVTRASDPFIKELAAAIKAAQQPEIDEMTKWLDEWNVPVMEAGDAMGAHGGHGMAGMLTEEQLADLEAASGAQFDRLFAEYMIAHHEGAIDMAEDVEDSKDPRVAALAQAIIAAQRAEIAQMQAFLDRTSS